jgi:hypothetical protein
MFPHVEAGRPKAPHTGTPVASAAKYAAKVMFVASTLQERQFASCGAGKQTDALAEDFAKIPAARAKRAESSSMGRMCGKRYVSESDG